MCSNDNVETLVGVISYHVSNGFWKDFVDEKQRYLARFNFFI